jgi:hypothetical protein
MLLAVSCGWRLVAGSAGGELQWSAARSLVGSDSVAGEQLAVVLEQPHELCIERFVKRRVADDRERSGAAGELGSDREEELVEQACGE